MKVTLRVFEQPSFNCANISRMLVLKKGRGISQMLIDIACRKEREFAKIVM